MTFGNLSKLLEKVSAKGADAFYTGTYANEMIDLINSNGGNLTQNDLSSYQAKETRTYSTEFGGMFYFNQAF